MTGTVDTSLNPRGYWKEANLRSKTKSRAREAARCVSSLDQTDNNLKEKFRHLVYEPEGLLVTRSNGLNKIIRSHMMGKGYGNIPSHAIASPGRRPIHTNAYGLCY